ncbi:sex peptide receptor-like [Physella acuta]|uniref:sex peptide receptor-like n=1 Tax=Physella acuta TaxID=109671 RepID=UPI0027DC034D|nr:sex peptide receptor-like [Physella acuta]
MDEPVSTSSSTLDQITVAVVQVSSEQGCDYAEYIPGFVSNATSRGLVKFYLGLSKLHGYIAVAVCLFGVLSNSANIIVLTRRNMSSSTNTLLLWLAVADLLTMVEYLPFALHFYVMEPSDPTHHPFSSRQFHWICFLLFHASFSIVCHTVAIWLTIALAIFRYIYICKPTSGVHYCSQHRARVVVFMVVMITIVICLPNFAVNTYDIQFPMSNLLTNNEDVYYYPTLRMSTTFDLYLIQVNNWVQAILMKLIPCFMLTTLTLLLVVAVHKAYRKRLKLKSQGRKAESDKHGEHNRITGMLLAIVVLFTLTELPQGILTLMNIFVTCFTQVVYYKLGDLLDLMALTNNSVNFVLYCSMSTQFRATFADIFCPGQTAQPKWLKLRIIHSRYGDSNSVDGSDTSRTRRTSKSGFISRCTEFTETDGISKVVFDKDDA